MLCYKPINSVNVTTICCFMLIKGGWFQSHSIGICYKLTENKSFDSGTGMIFKVPGFKC